MPHIKSIHPEGKKEEIWHSFDMDETTQAIVMGTKKQDCVQALEQLLQQAADTQQWSEATEQKSPDDMCKLLAAAFSEAAEQTLGKNETGPRARSGEGEPNVVTTETAGPTTTTATGTQRPCSHGGRGR